MTHTRLLSATLLGISVLLLACSSNKNPNAPGRVSGTISYKGQPLRGGNMNFHSATGGANSATISSDGTYSATDIPVGEMVVTVDTESLNPAKVGGGAGRTAEAKARAESEKRQMSSRPGAPGGGGSAPETTAPEYVKIPKKYASPKTSPLTVEIKAGRQVHNIELTD